MKQVVKFEIGDLMPIGFVLIVVGIAVSYGLQVMGDVRDTTCEDDGGVAYGGQCWTDSNHNVSDALTTHYNATNDALSGVAKLPAKLPLIATVVVAAIILGIVVKYLAFRNN